MEKISFDSGIRQFQLNGKGILRFNPSDPNLYERFTQAGEKILDIEKNLLENAGEERPLKVLAQADREMKKLLSWVFGEENDFDQLLEGVNVLAVAANGQQVITNLLAALEPVIAEGVKNYVNLQVQEAKEKADLRREALK